jgi:iron(III) transport system permease protein
MTPGSVDTAPPRGAGAGAPPRPGAQSSARRSGRPPVYLWLPAAGVALVMLLPLAYLLLRTAGAGDRALAILLEPYTLRVLGNSVVLAILVTGCSALIAVPVAWLTSRTDLPARRAWAVLTALPLCIPTYVGGFALVAAFGPRGMLQSVLAPLGVDRLPEIYGLPGAVLALTLFSYPYLLLTVRAGIMGMDPAFEEAGRSLGRSPARTFLTVTLPQLRPAIGAGCLLVALYALSDFGAVSLLRFNSFTRAIFVQYQAALDRTPAAVLAVALVALTVLLLAAEARTRGPGSYHRAEGGTPRAAQPVALGRWRWPAVALCAVVVTAALVIPLAVIGYWLVRGVSAGEPLRLAGVAAWNSVRASGLAAAVAAVAALPVVFCSVRYRSTVTRLLERATYIGYALPGIVVALSLVFFGARYGGPLYQTLALLVLAYVVRFLPQAVGATRAAALQVSPALEEAARGLGRSQLRAITSVTVPLVRPGVLAGAALVFLTAMKELPATLLLGPTGYPTLATMIWSATSEAFFARAAAPALLLVLLAGVPLAVVLGGRPRWAGGAP